MMNLIPKHGGKLEGKPKGYYMNMKDCPFVCYDMGYGRYYSEASLGERERGLLGE